MGHGGQIGGKMIQELEHEIRDLQKELAGVQKDQSALRLQPCRGDSEIMKKDAKYDELDRRATIIRATIRDLTRKRQLLISETKNPSPLPFLIPENWLYRSLTRVWAAIRGPGWRSRYRVRCGKDEGGRASANPE
jgi:hypothetical protein